MNYFMADQYRVEGYPESEKEADERDRSYGG